MSRYIQQQLLHEVGISGQKKLENTSILVIGAGGLGTVVATYLASMGFGKIGICDHDVIAESNLHRQFLYTCNDIGLFKSNRLSEVLKLQNPHINVEPFCEKLDANNSSSLILPYDILCDCTDTADSRQIIDEICEKHNKILVHGAVSEWQGYVTVLHYKRKFSLSNLFDMEGYLNAQSCSIGGINPAICGIIGGYMSNECLKICLDLDGILDGKFLYVNGLSNVNKVFSLKR